MKLPIILFCLSACTFARGQLSPILFKSSFLLQDTSLLPVQRLSLTQKDNKVLLRWRGTNSLPDAESFYAVERSSNGTDFSMLGITRNSKAGWFEFLDDTPGRGKTFYRIKVSSDQKVFYSEAVEAISQAAITCKFYPNPVDKVLIIRSELAVELQIADGYGKPILNEKLPAGLRVVDVSALEPGVYVLTLFQKESGRVITEKLVKK